MRVSSKTNASAKRILWRRLSRKVTLQSVLLSLISWFGGPTPGAAQDTGQFPAGPPIVYVSNAVGEVTEMNAATNNSVIATAPFTNNANSAAVGVQALDLVQVGQ